MTVANEELLNAVKHAYAYWLLIAREAVGKGNPTEVPYPEIFGLLGGRLVEALRDSIGPFEDDAIIYEVMKQIEAEQIAGQIK